MLRKSQEKVFPIEVYSLEVIGGCLSNVQSDAVFVVKHRKPAGRLVLLTSATVS